MSAQEVTLQQYHQWMKMNAATHLIRSAREIGIFAELRNGQRTLDQLCETASLRPESAKLLLDGLVAIGIIEQYGDDYALSRAAHLLCQYDDDLGDRRWDALGDLVRGRRNRADSDDQQHFDHQAATQWVHTATAMQVAEILDVGGEGEPSGIAILDLGCGSAVWSCAMAHRDAVATVLAVDDEGAIEAAQSTADSIELGDRFQAIVSAPGEAALPADQFDLVLLAQRLNGLNDAQASSLLGIAVAACKPGGRVVVIDTLVGPAKPTLVDAIEALRLDLETRGGRMRTLQETQRMFGETGLSEIQFTPLAASQTNLGLVVGVK